jgi:hypothetical protein
VDLFMLTKIKTRFAPTLPLLKLLILILSILIATIPVISFADDSILFPQLKSQTAQNISGNWLVNLSDKDGKVLHNQHIVIEAPYKSYCEAVSKDVCNYRVMDDPDGKWDSYYYGDGNIFDRGFSFGGPYTLNYEHSYGIGNHWGSNSKIIFSRDKGVGKWESQGRDGGTGREEWTRLLPKISKITFSGVSRGDPPVVSTVSYGVTGKVTGKLSPLWGPNNTAPGTRPYFNITIYGENLWGHHVIDMKHGVGFDPLSHCKSLYDKNSKNLNGHIGLKCTVNVWHGTSNGTKIWRLDNLELPFDLDIIGLKDSDDAKPEKSIEANMELKFIKPKSLKQASNSNTHYYPIDPKSAVVFELKNVGKKPLEEVQLIFNLNHGSIKQFTGDGKTCAWNRNTNKGSCGFVSIEPGKSKQIGLMLHVTGLNLERENSYRDKLKIETVARAQDLKDKKETVEINFEECASQYKDKLVQNRMDALGRYHKGSFSAMHKRDDYPTKRTYEHKKTKSSRIRESNALVLEMLANGGNDVYLANGAANKGKKGIRDLFFDYIKTMPEKTIGGNVCALPSDPVAKAIQRSKEFKKRAKEISIRAERDRREAKRWTKAIHDALNDVGTQTGRTTAQRQDAPEGSKELEFKVEMFSFSQGMQALSKYFQVGLGTSAALGKTMGFLSLAMSAKQIVESTWDSIKLARISLFDVFQGLAAIETAAHMQVLNERYKAIDKTNDAMIKELNEIYKNKCSCKVPFE